MRWFPLFLFAAFAADAGAQDGAPTPKLTPSWMPTGVTPSYAAGTPTPPPPPAPTSAMPFADAPTPRPAASGVPSATPRSEVAPSPTRPPEMGTVSSVPFGPPVTAEPETPTGFSFKDYSRNMVLVEGDEGVGTGFIGRMLDKPYLFTNTHVISGNKTIKARTLDGRELKLGGLSVAETYDVSVFQQMTITEGGLEIIKNADSEVSIGDDVVVLGNSLGGGVVTQIPGKVTGLGPELVEVDAKFVSGNSGSPVIHVKTGKVIGIATFVTIRKMETVGKDSKFNNVERHFAYRLDNVPTWRNTTWAAFQRESAVVTSIEEHTNDIWALAEDIAKNGRVTKWGAHLRKGNCVSQHVADFQRTINKPGVSMEDATKAKQSLVYWINLELKKDLQYLKYDGYIGYNRKKIDDAKQDRTMLKQYFDAVRDNLESR